MFFAEVITPRVAGSVKIAARDRCSYLRTLVTDMKYMCSAGGRLLSLDELLDEARTARGPPSAKRLLRTLKPEFARGGSLVRAVARTRGLLCQGEDCRFKTADLKALYRHIRNSHPEEKNRLLASAQAAPGEKATTSCDLPRTGKDGRMLPVPKQVSLRVERIAKRKKAVRPCPVPRCSHSFQTTGWLKRHLWNKHRVVMDEPD